MNEKINILIVDDNINLCKTMSFVLKRKGYNVTIANDGIEAINRVEEKPFDIIFLDIKLPLMDGVETYRRIKKIRPEVVTLMMTAYSVEELIQEALEEGVFGVLYKPFDLEKVISLIETARENKKGGFIMIVDDDLSFSITIKNVLTKRGYVIGIAHSGEEAIEIVKVKNYDIILIDMKLPAINGLETYLSIKEIDPKIVAIMITGYRKEVDDLIQEAIENNAFTCLYKPIDMELLLNLINKILLTKKKFQNRIFSL